jgi:methionyl-tRNA formyltransferase
MSERLVFFGTDAFSVPSLIRLLAEGRRVVAVVTKPDSRVGRGREMTSPAVKRLADASGIPVLQPGRLADIASDLQAIKPSAGIVVAYGKIIPQAILDLFPKALINVHASLLPLYRGASPIEHAILSGDDVTGVTLMQLEAGLDTGPTYEAAKLQLTGTETRPELYERLAELGAELLASKLTAILDGTIVPIPQDNSLATHTSRISKADGLIDWHKPAAQLEREVRAYLIWPGSHTTIAGSDVVVTAAHVSPTKGPAGEAHRTPAGELAVFTAKGALVIDRLKPAGKREMTGPEFLAGHPLPHR